MSLKLSPSQRQITPSNVIQNWLASWDFLDNPFALWEAGREPWLQRYFIKRPYFEQLLKDSRSTLIFAPRGGGKSATRIMIEAECRPALPMAPVLAVSFTDFSPFIEAVLHPGYITLKDYLPPLISAIIPQVLKALIANPEIAEKLTSTIILSHFHYWINQFTPFIFSRNRISSLLRDIEPDLEKEYLETVTSCIHKSMPPPPGLKARHSVIIQWLLTLRAALPMPPEINIDSPILYIGSFVQLVLQILSHGPRPCDVIYVLIDGIDEYAMTQNNPEASAKILEPLLGTLPLLELPGLAVKFFLPTEQQATLESVTRPDRVDIISLSWDLPFKEPDQDDLRYLLRRRISAFNTRGIQTLDELCDPSLRRWLENAMLEEARDSPRSLMRLGNLLFAEHCREIPASGSVILPIEWEQALERFRATVRTQANVEQVHYSPPPLREHSREQFFSQLRVNLQAGDVYRGSELLPPLSDLEYRLLAFLYRNKGRICSKDEISLAVYEPKYENPDISDQAIAGLINRLRKRVEPESKNPIYLITVKGRGYRLDNAE